MIEVFGYGGPNPRKVTIFLEEAGIDYKFTLVDLYQGAHKGADYLRINPNGRLPAIVDHDVTPALALWESGAILIYLAEKSGKLLPTRGRQRYDVLKWLAFQISHAPYWGTAHVYRLFAPEPMPYNIDRFTRESARLYQLLDQQLAEREYLATEYSIADIAMYPWIEYHSWHGQNLDDYPSLKRWFESVRARPAVQKGRSIPWPFEEFAPNEAGQQAKIQVDSRLADPEWARPIDGGFDEQRRWREAIEKSK